MDTPAAQTLTARFAADLAACGYRGGTLGLAVSGGPDSLALLWLAHAAGIPFAVATVDHGLRPEAVGEAEAVAARCCTLSARYAVLKVTVPHAGNLQANARTARYAALGQWAREEGVSAIATAHHADDQAETLLLRLMRGAGLRGLAGMRPIAPAPGAKDIALLRPLLGWRRAELAAIVAAAGWSAADDPSNHDPRFERVALRQRLAEAPWLDPAPIAAAADHLAQADEALSWAAEGEWQDRVLAEPDGSILYRPSAPTAIRLRVLERILAQLATEGTPRGGEVARFLARLEAGHVSTLAGVRCAPRPDGWHFSPAPPRRG